MTPQHLPGRPRRLLAAVAAGVLAITTFSIGASAPAAADAGSTRPTAVVAMGDSLSAGEGGGDYEPGSNEFGHYCHRSSMSEIHQAKLSGVTTTVNLACSAATTDDVRLGGTRRYGEPPQAEQLKAVARRYEVRSIVLTVGANDVPSVGLTIHCILAYVGGQACAGWWDKRLPKKLATIREGVVGDLRDIRAVMRQAGYRDDSYELVLQSYPSPSGGRTRYRGAARVLHGCPFRDSDIAWVHDTVFPMIAQYLRQAAETVPGVRFLDLTAALEGRQACSPGIDSSQEWMWGAFVDLPGLRIGPGPHLVSQSLHPKAVGYGYIAGCLRDFHALSARNARCVREADGEVRLTADDGVRAPATP
ncbi:GDSL-type esterase/lipase family protein [Actinoplanes sp. NPDC049118]|uniref:GDSL-type esterase/lipase family protein n=1 Tax=Actinoplanes sp. NPDC049118 TaxID=3155769 RepID=UPI0033C30033